MRLLSLEIIILRNTELFFNCTPSFVLPAVGILGQLIFSHVSLSPTCADAVPGPHRSHCAMLHLESPGSQTLPLHYFKEAFLIWNICCFVPILLIKNLVDWNTPVIFHQLRMMRISCTDLQNLFLWSWCFQGHCLHPSMLTKAQEFRAFCHC